MKTLITWSGESRPGMFPNTAARQVGPSVVRLQVVIDNALIGRSAQIAADPRVRCLSARASITTVDVAVLALPLSEWVHW